MKKALAFIAVALVAVATQAATMTWGSGKLYVPEEDGTFSSTAAKATVSAVVMLVSSADYATYSAMSQEDLYKAYTDGKIAATETASGESKSMSSAANITTTTDFAKGAYGYAVAIYTTSANGKDYYITATGYDHINDAGEPAGDKASNLASAVGKWSVVSSTPVPEPCTVALLALGLAAAGLKRKVA